MPEFKKVPDATGWWIKFYGNAPTRKGALCRFENTTFGIRYADHLLVAPQPQHCYTWYGPLPSRVPDEFLYGGE